MTSGAAGKAAVWRRTFPRPCNYQSFREALDDAVSDDTFEGEVCLSIRVPKDLYDSLGHVCSYITQILEGVSAGAKTMKEAVICPTGIDRVSWKIASLILMSNLTIKMCVFFSSSFSVFIHYSSFFSGFSLCQCQVFPSRGLLLVWNHGCGTKCEVFVGRQQNCERDRGQCVCVGVLPYKVALRNL